jgi:hypothetical protein
MSRVGLSTVGDEDTDWIFDPDEDSTGQVGKSKPIAKNTLSEIHNTDDDEDLLLFKIPDIPTSTNKSTNRPTESQRGSNFDTSLIAGSFNQHAVDNSLHALFGDDDNDEKATDDEDEEDFLIRTQPFLSSTQVQPANKPPTQHTSSYSDDFQFKKPSPVSETTPNEDTIVLGTQTPTEIISDINNNSGETKSPQKENSASRSSNKTVDIADLVVEADKSIWNFAKTDLYRLFNSSKFNQKNVFDALTLKYYYEKVKHS